MNQNEFDKQLNEIMPLALKQIKSQIGLEHIEQSLRSVYVLFQQNRHGLEFFKNIPLNTINDTETFHRMTAYFFPYQWDAYDYAERSMIECLCTYYSVSFALLRMTYDMVIRGAFWLCMTNENYRSNATILNRSWKQYKKLK